VLLMAYIGGLGFFIGPIVGAVVLTLINSLLSNYTDLWMLYLGILFLLTVMFLPRGLTGLLMMHRVAWQLGRMRLLLLPYTLTAIPGAVFLLGMIAMIEMSRAEDAEFMYLGLALAPSGYGSWALLLGVTAVAFFILRRSLPRLREAWLQANTLPRPQGHKDGHP
jgi:branched-chain amino acid transport system permease protein